jgi:UDP-glucose 4-epimerase
MKILVTGGAGFIGSHLVDRLIKENYQVIVVDNLSTGKKENLNPKAQFYQLDILDPKLSEVFQKEKPEVVFHYAAQIDVRKSVKNPLEDAKINILGSLNLLENCKRFKVKKFIFASSGGAIYGQADIVPTPESYPAWPLSPYGVAKLTIEKYLNYYYKVFGLPYTSLRLANVYGPRQNPEGEAGVVAIFCHKLLKGEQPVINGDGTQTRDYVFVDDVVEANLLALEKDKVDIFNVGTAKETSVNEIFQRLKRITGAGIEGIHGPAKQGEQKRSCLDFSKIKKELDWQPNYSLEQGLEKTVNYFKSF